MPGDVAFRCPGQPNLNTGNETLSVTNLVMRLDRPTILMALHPHCRALYYAAHASFEGPFHAGPLGYKVGYNSRAWWKEEKPGETAVSKTINHTHSTSNSGRSDILAPLPTHS